jgi:hypothetical protein
LGAPQDVPLKCEAEADSDDKQIERRSANYTTMFTMPSLPRDRLPFKGTRPFIYYISNGIYDQLCYVYNIFDLEVLHHLGQRANLLAKFAESSNARHTSPAVVLVLGL